VGAEKEREKEFAKLRGARAFLGRFTALPVTSMVKFLEKMDGHRE
jgi:hypothetical protein